MTPLVSVVIPCYNSERFLRHCLISVARQTWRPLEVVVVDDGSTDETPQIVLDFAGRNGGEGLDVRLIQHGSNQGAAAALRTGLGAATGSALCWLSSDDSFVDRDKTTRQLAFLRRSNGFVYDGLFLMGPEENSAAPFRSAWPTLMRRSPRLAQGFPDAWLLGLWFSNPINGSTVMLSQQALAEVGTFDPVLGNVDADADLWMRFAASGRSPVCADDGSRVPSILYRTHAGQTSAKYESMQKGMAVSRVRSMTAVRQMGVLDRIAHENRWLLAAAAVHRRHTVMPHSAQYLVSSVSGAAARGMRYDLRRLGLWLDQAKMAELEASVRALASSSVFVASTEAWELGS